MFIMKLCKNLSFMYSCFLSKFALLCQIDERHSLITSDMRKVKYIDGTWTQIHSSLGHKPINLGPTKGDNP